MTTSIEREERWIEAWNGLFDIGLPAQMPWRMALAKLPTFGGRF